MLAIHVLTALWSVGAVSVIALASNNALSIFNARWWGCLCVMALMSVIDNWRDDLRRERRAVRDPRENAEIGFGG